MRRSVATATFPGYLVLDGWDGTAWQPVGQLRGLGGRQHFQPFEGTAVLNLPGIGLRPSATYTATVTLPTLDPGRYRLAGAVGSAPRIVAPFAVQPGRR